jgi:thiol-disulfide isomerase/thioredoxin
VTGWRRYRAGLIVLGVVVVAVVIAELTGGSGQSQASRRAAPELPSKVLQGPPVTVASLRGKPAIVHFWASWCTPCNKEAPELARLAGELHGRATLVGVDFSDNPANAARFLRDHGWRFPVLEDRAGSSGNRYDLNGLPTTFVLDSRGRIVRQLPGPQTAKGLLAQVRSTS